MSVKKKIALLIVALSVIALNIAIFMRKAPDNTNVTLEFTVEADAKTNISLFYTNNGTFDVGRCLTQTYEKANTKQKIKFSINSVNSAVRIDLGDTGEKFHIRDACYSLGLKNYPVDLRLLDSANALEVNNVLVKSADTNELQLEILGEDPYIAGNAGPSMIRKQIEDYLGLMNLIKKTLCLILLDAACLILFRFRRRFSSLPIELFQNRKLILNLAVNDFKTKYAGSYLGITWAFVQPIITVLVYWFVFQVGLRSGAVGSFPFVLWLIAGLVPWFFFQDTLNGGTNALIEYSYLVKKVVFKISVLPIVKAFSALFVHAFFVAFTIFLYTCYGYWPDLYVLQVFYYTFALFVFTLGICYATCAIVIFFRDLTQIINIVLQVGIWMTPIMWNIEVIGAGFPRWLTMIFKANPLYYVVNGYRDALINKVWFWERFDLTFYYWTVTAVVFVIGTVVFKRLKVHFADIL